MGPLIHVIYASAATREFTTDEILRLGTGSCARNSASGVSGMLLFCDGSFFQILEGECDRVHTLMDRIRADPRHTEITTIIEEPIARRSFGEWSMGSAALSVDELASVPGLNDFFTEGACLRELDDGRARRLLKAFKVGRWRLAPAEAA